MTIQPSPRHWRLRWEFLRHHRSRGGKVLQGHHHHNLVVKLREPLASIVGLNAGQSGKFRTPLQTPEVLPRMWTDEAEVLNVVKEHVPGVPRPLGTVRRRALYTYIEGETLAETAPPGTPLSETMPEIASLFGQISGVPVAALPAISPTWSGDHSAEWPSDGDSAGFLHRLVRFAEQRVHLRNRRHLGNLFDELGIPKDAIERFHTKAKVLQSRPFGLLHADIHRANLVRARTGELCLVDWEHALLGDPLHDLATHLVRMDYTPQEQRLMIMLWRKEMAENSRADRLAGVHDPTLPGTSERATDDLGVYLDFEYAQSVFTDTIRATLPLRRPNPDYGTAAGAVHRALQRARDPLEMKAEEIPSVSDVREALHKWATGSRPTPLKLNAVPLLFLRR